jgi:hypothetical protein
MSLVASLGSDSRNSSVTFARGKPSFRSSADAPEVRIDQTVRKASDKKVSTRLPITDFMFGVGLGCAGDPHQGK